MIHGEMGNPRNPIPPMGGQGRIPERLYQCDSTREEVGKQGRSSLDAPLLDRKSRFGTVLKL